MTLGADTAALPDAVRVLGMVVAAALAAGALLLPGARARAIAMLAALLVTPVLLVAEIWETPQLASVRERPTAVAVACAVGLLVLCVLAWALARRPGLLAALAVGALPFRIPVEAGGATANLLVPLYLVIAAGALAWAVPRLRGEQEPPRAERGLERLLAAVVVLYALQSAYSGDLDKALEQVVFFYVPFALLFALLRDLDWTPRRLRLCLGVLVALALAFVAVGFVEYQTRELLLNPKVIASNQVEEYFRVNSLFFDPNIYGRFLALVMLCLSALLLWGRRTRDIALAVAALAVLWGGLVLTLSQSSFAALLAGLLVLAAMRYPGRRALAAAGAVVVVGVIVVVAFPGALRLDLGSAKSIDRATSGRFDLMSGGIELARERPIAGWGSGSFRSEYRRRQNASSERAVSASHTTPITVAAEQGLIGLAAYLALLAAALARLLRGASGWPARAVIAAGFVALVIHTWLYASFLEDPMTWTLLGVGVALARMRRVAPPEDEGPIAASPPESPPQSPLSPGGSPAGTPARS
jgi:O-antigen ligase